MKSLLAFSPVLLLPVLIVGCSENSAAEAGPPAAASESVSPEDHEFVYSAHSNGRSSVTFITNETTSSEDFIGEWSKTVELGPDEYMPMFTVQTLSGNGSEISCEVAVDGDQIQFLEASGNSANVMCNPGEA
jgi:hypothetical protein